MYRHYKKNGDRFRELAEVITQPNFILLLNAITIHQLTLCLTILIIPRPTSPDGILLLTGESADMTGDYLALLIRDGHVELR